MQRILAYGIVALLGSIGTAWAANVALVIGNNDYQHAPDARTAVADAKAVALKLKAGGWDVTLQTDVNRAEMRIVIEEFHEKVKAADAVVIYYSGHALRSAGRTYLAPTSARNDTLSDVYFKGVPFELFTRIAAEKPGRAVIFLDAAQLRGFPPRSFAEPGLAPFERPDRLMIVSAAQPRRAIVRRGSGPSEFARTVTDIFLAPGVSVARAVKTARPPTYSVGFVDNGFVIVPSSRVVARKSPTRPRKVERKKPVRSKPTAPPKSSDIEAKREYEFWLGVKRADRADLYRKYLAEFPDGLYADLARIRLKELTRRTTGKTGTPPTTGDAPTPEEIEDDLALTRSDRRDVQRSLEALGFDPKGVDGLFGSATRTALKAWQRARTLAVTGYLDRRQYRRLTREGRRAIAEARRKTEAERRAAEAADNTHWELTGKAGTEKGLKDYLKKYPAGIHADEARRQLRVLVKARTDANGERDRRAWRLAANTHTIPGYREYLRNFPEGAYREMARAELRALGAPVAKPPAKDGGGKSGRRPGAHEHDDDGKTGRRPGTGDHDGDDDGKTGRRPRTGDGDGHPEPGLAEDKLKLTRAERRAVERRLNALGFGPVTADGRFGPSTRTAIGDYQRAEGLPETGYLNRRTYNRLMRRARRTGRFRDVPGIIERELKKLTE